MTDRIAPPLVSVVLCTYNGAAFLEGQLASLLNQTHRPIEIIAVDDGSSDATVTILQDAAARHPHMKVFVNETNLGFVKNFEKGCRLSTGAYIALCDQDDFWLPDKIEKMVRAIGDYPMIYCDSKLWYEDSRTMRKNLSDVVPYQTFHDPLQLCIFSRMYGNATLFSRSLFLAATPFLDEVPHDGWLAYHATFHGGVKYLPEALLLYRQHKENLFGVVGRKVKKKKESRSAATRRGIAQARIRMRAYYEACPESFARQKRTLLAIMESYRSFSLPNNIRRVAIFWANCRLLLTIKNYARWRKYVFCLKMFYKIK
jgi:glycosyltransferase involved in cell wall biosynthesis